MLNTSDMINNLIQFLTSIIVNFIGMTGYGGIFVLMAAESALIPIPSEITMPFAGFLAYQGKLNIFLVILVGAVANLAGSLLAFGLGWWGEEHLVRSLIRKYGKFLLISESEYDQAEKWFRKYGQKIIFISRVLPIVRTFISLPAGIAEMNIWKFSIFTFIGSLIWSAFLTYIGFALGKNWHSIEIYYRKFEYLIVFAAVIAAAYYIYHKYKKLRKKN